MGVSKEKAEPMQDNLEHLIAGILDVPLTKVDSIMSDNHGHANVDFFIMDPSEETRDTCTSGKLQTDLDRALKNDDEVGSIFAGQCSN